MPQRGTTIDPFALSENRRISVGVSMPVKWVPIFKKMADEKGVSFSHYISVVCQLWAEKQGVKLPPAAEPYKKRRA